MAEIVPEMPTLRNSPYRRHDFVKYMDGQIWRLKRGVDFTCTVEAMRRQLNKYAAARAWTLECHQDTHQGYVWVKKI